MSDIINLNKVRKAKLKQQKATIAVHNRVVFGTSTHDRKVERRKQERERGTLAGHLRKASISTKDIDEEQ